VFLSPEYRAQPVGLPVEASVNCTVSGVAPDIGLAEKTAGIATTPVTGINADNYRNK
jgi:hypothetical protein